MCMCAHIPVCGAQNTSSENTFSSFTRWIPGPISGCHTRWQELLPDEPSCWPVSIFNLSKWYHSPHSFFFFQALPCILPCMLSDLRPSSPVVVTHTDTLTNINVTCSVHVMLTVCIWSQGWLCVLANQLGSSSLGGSFLPLSVIYIY